MWIEPLHANTSTMHRSSRERGDEAATASFCAVSVLECVVAYAPPLPPLL
jgi:hypothetical protein